MVSTELLEERFVDLEDGLETRPSLRFLEHINQAPPSFSSIGDTQSRVPSFPTSDVNDSVARILISGRPNIGPCKLQTTEGRTGIRVSLVLEVNEKIQKGVGT